MCDDQSPSSWRISSAKSVSSAWMPAAASASLRRISSVVSDFTLTTSSALCADVGLDRAPRVAQLLPVRELLDDAGALRADRVGGGAQVRPHLGVLELG